ncbi:hypothetical protein V6N11_072450 [Hibiscus sabdariffa]|uniref:Uncharacterized protein n=1 Tax=Hibiscus sabdariffa TaxID=183260 RepID=A0ABR2U331_9ROSI
MEQVKAYSAEEGEATSVGSQRGGQKNGETTKTQVLSELEHGPGTDSQTHNCQQIKGFWNQGQTRQIEEANSVILSPLNLETFRQPSIVVQCFHAGYLVKKKKKDPQDLDDANLSSHLVPQLSRLMNTSIVNS